MVPYLTAGDLPILKALAARRYAVAREPCAVAVRTGLSLDVVTLRIDTLCEMGMLVRKGDNTVALSAEGVVALRDLGAWSIRRRSEVSGVE